MISRSSLNFICLALIFLYQLANADTADRIMDSLKINLLQTQSKIEQADIILKLSESASNSDRRLSLKYAEELLQIAQEIQVDSITNKARLNMARINLLIGNYPKSLDFYQQVTKSESADSSNLLLAYNGIGIINYYQRDYKNAISSYNKALSFAAAIKSNGKQHRNLKQNLLNNLGILYEEMKELDKADKYYSESLLLSRQINDLTNIAHVLTNQGRLYHKQGKDELAVKNYQEALKIRQDQKDQNGLALSYDGLGEYYFDRNDYALAEEHLKKAIAIAKETGDLLTVKRSSTHLYKIYEKQGRFQLAFQTLILNKEASDSLFNDERANKIRQLKAEFEYERKHNEEKALQREKELTYVMIGLGLLFLLIIVSLLFYLQRNKVRSSLLQQAHLELEKENLEKDIKLKDKELTASTLHLMQKNELIDEISEKLLKIKAQTNEDSQYAIQKVVTDLQSNLRPELLKEFEFRFQQVHEDFYDILNTRFPLLTPNERKLCAFLKLGLTTKEISAITHQNIKSIEIARTRLRKKLNLTNQDYNLVTFLSQLTK